MSWVLIVFVMWCKLVIINGVYRVLKIVLKSYFIGLVNLIRMIVEIYLFSV